MKNKMKKITNFLENEGFYNMTSEEKDEILELEEVKENDSSKTFMYRDPNKKSLFERIKDALQKL